MTLKSFRIGTYRGAQIWVRPEALVLCPMLMIPSAIRDPVAAVVLIFVLFASILAHEIGHAYAAHRLGLRVEGILHFGIAGFCFFEDPGPDVARRMTIAAAGPLANLAIALALIPIAAHLDPATHIGSIFVAAVAMNIVLCVGNLLPIFPLDGAQILFACLERRWSAQTAMLVTSALGVVLCGPAILFCAIFTLLGFPVILVLMLPMNWRVFKKAWATHRAHRPETRHNDAPADRLMADILAEASRRNATRPNRMRRSTHRDLN